MPNNTDPKLTWTDPPETKNSGGRGGAGRWNPVTAELRANPGRWALKGAMKIADATGADRDLVADILEPEQENAA